MGLPLHPLVVHAAVVLVPLLALAAVAYALVPRLRKRVGWLAVTLAVLAPVATVAAKLSGDAFRDRRNLPAEMMAQHRDYGTATMWATIILGAVTLALVYVRRGGGGEGRDRIRGVVGAVLTVLVVVFAGAAAVYVALTGDSGARSVWEDLWSVT